MGIPRDLVWDLLFSIKMVTIVFFFLFLSPGQRPFKCSYCPYSASQKGNLKTHVLCVHRMPFDNSQYPDRRFKRSRPEYDIPEKNTDDAVGVATSNQLMTGADGSHGSSIELLAGDVLSRHQDWSHNEFGRLIASRGEGVDSCWTIWNVIDFIRSSDNSPNLRVGHYKTKRPMMKTPTERQDNERETKVLWIDHTSYVINSK